MRFFLSRSHLSPIAFSLPLLGVSFILWKRTRDASFVIWTFTCVCLPPVALLINVLPITDTIPFTGCVGGGVEETFISTYLDTVLLQVVSDKKATQMPQMPAIRKKTTGGGGGATNGGGGFKVFRVWGLF
jgi:hypothetical protein